MLINGLSIIRNSKIKKLMNKINQKIVLDWESDKLVFCIIDWLKPKSLKILAKLITTATIAINPKCSGETNRAIIGV